MTTSENETLKKIGKTIQTRREALGLSIDRTAEDSALGRYALKAIECGELDFTIDMLQALSRTLDMSAASILGQTSTKR